MGLFFGLIISAIGLAYFSYGKKVSNLNFLLFGLILMVYPYFTQNITWILILGGIFLVGPFITNRFFEF